MKYIKLFERYLNDITYLKDNIKKGNVRYLTYKKDLKNDWLVHVTSISNAKDILKNGFKIGYSNFDQLASTQRAIGTESQSFEEGYNFAYTIEDMIKHGTSIDFSHIRNKVFTVPHSILVYNEVDYENQVIFLGSDVKKVKLINRFYNQEDDSWYLNLMDKDGKTVIHSIEDINKNSLKDILKTAKKQ